MPSLAPFGGFVPTVANLDGQATAEILVGGTVAAPEITGNVDATRCRRTWAISASNYAMAGCAARRAAAAASSSRASVASGKGHVELAGAMDEHGVIDAHILGQNFQAADIPAAAVTLTPDLKLTGDPKGYLLKGEVTIPRADINLQKLPKDESPGVSPDVVVIRNGKEARARCAGIGAAADGGGHRDAGRRHHHHGLWTGVDRAGSCRCAKRRECRPRARASSRWQARTRPMARI